MIRSLNGSFNGKTFPHSLAYPAGEADFVFALKILQSLLEFIIVLVIDRQVVVMLYKSLTYFTYPRCCTCAHST